MIIHGARPCCSRLSAQTDIAPAGHLLECGTPQNAAQMTVPDIIKIGCWCAASSIEILCHIIVLAFTPHTTAVQLLQSMHVIQCRAFTSHRMHALNTSEGRAFSSCTVPKGRYKQALWGQRISVHRAAQHILCLTANCIQHKHITPEVQALYQALQISVPSGPCI